MTVSRICICLVLISLAFAWLLPAPAGADTATATIEGAAGGSEVFGWATFADGEGGLRVEVEIFGAPPGMHALHIHEKGSCEEAGKAAGDHYNPKHTKHGFLPQDGEDGAHLGDLGNIEIAPEGDGFMEMTLPQLTVAGGKFNIAERAVILHEKEDDFGQPAGNAGGRIGCGVIQREE